MPNTTRKTLYEKIFSELSNDATLKSYVKKFSRALANDVTKMSWPCIVFGWAGDSLSPLTIGMTGGKDFYEYNFLIEIYVYGLADDFVIIGQGANKGILDIIEDVENVVLWNRFDNLITKPAQITRVTPVGTQIGSNFYYSAELILTCTDYRTRS